MKNIPIIFMLIFLVGLTGAQTSPESAVNLYILSFDNFKADPEIDWLKESFVDYLLDYFQNQPGIKVRRASELNTLTEQIKSQPEMKKNKNYLLTGNYQRVEGQFEINLQLTDVNTWETIEKKKISEKTSDLAEVIESVRIGAAQLVGLQAPQTSGAQSGTVMTETELKPFQETIAATKKIADAIDRLSNVFQPPVSQAKASQPASQIVGVPADDINRRFGESIRRSESFQDIVYRVARNPYKLEISEPLFHRQALNEEKIKVTFVVRFVPNRELVRDMLETFPFKFRDENEGCLEYIYSTERFLFQDDLSKAIARGELRFNPVISFITDNGSIAGTLIDVPRAFSKNIATIPNVEFVAKYQPLINLTTSTLDLQINLKNTEAEIEYSLEMSIEQLKRIDRIDVLFLSEAEILDYLKTLK